MPAKQPLSADDLYRMRIITGYELSPDGRHVIYAVQRVDRASEEKYSDLWLVSTESGEPRRFTGGDYVDRAPRWSPDGRQIAFLSNRADKEQFQLYVIPVDGGEAQRVTEAEGDFGSFVWSPDGSTILYQFRKRDAAVKEREADPQKKKLGVVARHITRLVHKWDGQGFLPEERWHLWTVAVATGKTVQLTDDNRYEEAEPAWSPDGRWIAFVSNRTPDPDLDQINTQIFVMPAAGGYFRAVDAPRGDMNSPVFSPDSTRIALARRASPVLAQHRPLGCARGRAVRLPTTSPHRWTSAPACAAPGRFPRGAGVAPGLVRGRSAALFQVSRHAAARSSPKSQDGGPDTYAVTLGEDEPSISRATMTPGSAWSTSAAQVEPGDLVTHLDTGHSLRLTHVNEARCANAPLGCGGEVWFRRDGHPLQGWIMTPPDFAPTSATRRFWRSTAGRSCNTAGAFSTNFTTWPGSATWSSSPTRADSRLRQRAHQDAIVNDFGAVAYDDLMAWTDHVTALPYVDAARVGVTGGSYGGYMTNWIVGHTDRFAAAVTQRSLCNLISFHGTSDFTWIFQFWFGDEPPWEDVENYWRQSPLKYVANVKTPTLVVHAEGDKRVSVEQSEQWQQSFASGGRAQRVRAHRRRVP
ncbi:MAG: prolyl oligopeptidase family serine peptidase [Caldilineaceae bacterium]